MRRTTPLRIVRGRCGLKLRLDGTWRDDLNMRECTIKNCRPVVDCVDRTSVPHSHTDQQTYQTNSPTRYATQPEELHIFECVHVSNANDSWVHDLRTSKPTSFHLEHVANEARSDCCTGERPSI